MNWFTVLVIIVAVVIVVTTILSGRKAPSRPVAGRREHDHGEALYRGGAASPHRDLGGGFGP